VQDIDTGDEQALRSLLLGIVHRSTNDFEASKVYLEEAHSIQKDGKVEVSTWISGVALFELAVTELMMFEHPIRFGGAPENKEGWEAVFKVVERRLDEAMAASPNTVDLSTRLDSRVMMLREEITTKKEMLGLL
jgi:hypothetical protein